MGLYLQGQEGKSKEEVLAEIGTKTTEAEVKARGVHDDDKWAVCLVNNGTFTAAAVVFDARELRDFTDPGDARPKRWFLVPENKFPGYVQEELAGHKN